MIHLLPRPDGWTWDDDGVLRPAADADAAHITHRSHLAPLVRVRDVAGDVIAAEPELAVDSISDPERITTDEGEVAALISIAGRLGDRPARRVVGIVFGDYAYSLIVGYSTDPAWFDELASAIRALVAAYRLGLGVRPRWFDYATPPGWSGIARGLLTEWYPPDYPRVSGSIGVSPAEPAPGVSPEQVFEGIIAADTRAGCEVLAIEGPDAIESTFGLAGCAWAILVALPDQSRLLRDVAILSDARYCHTFRLGTYTGEARELCLPVLRAIVSSVRPVPSPSGDGRALGHWIE